AATFPQRQGKVNALVCARPAAESDGPHSLSLGIPDQELKRSRPSTMGILIRPSKPDLRDRPAHWIGSDLAGPRFRAWSARFEEHWPVLDGRWALQFCPPYLARPKIRPLPFETRERPAPSPGQAQAISSRQRGPK